MLGGKRKNKLKNKQTNQEKRKKKEKKTKREKIRKNNERNQEKIDNTQQDRLCMDRDETVNPIMSECSKLAQEKYKSKHNWVGKVIHWELCKRLKFDHTTKW